MPEQKPRLITIEGPTAVGKTAVAIALAEAFRTEILSVDSRQFFREIPIGTAMPTAEEQSRVPHHFCAERSIHDGFTVYQFEQQALERLTDLFKTHQTVIACGGSGLYMQALLRGIDVLPDPDPKLREELQEIYDNQGIAPLQSRLEQLDPEYYGQVDRKNPVRLMRAIEVCLASGTSYTSLRTSTAPERPFSVTRLGLTMPRELLGERIQQRIQQMIGSGFLEEAARVHPIRGLVALKTIGYPEMFDVLDQKSTLDQGIQAMIINTRRYAKKQMTWLNRQAGITWFHPSQTDVMVRLLTKVHGQGVKSVN